MMGAAIGGALGHAVPGPPSLFSVVGMAAFLGAAYKVPLAGVAFVAETTGAPSYIIPGLLAAAIGYLVSGDLSLSTRQRFRRRLDLDTRLDLLVGEAMSRDWTEVPPAASVQEFASRYVTSARARTLPVAEGGRLLGMIGLDALSQLPAERWPSTPVEAVMRTDPPTTDPGWPLARAVRLMREHGVDRLPVVSDGQLVGMLTTSDILQLEEILETVGDREDG
jgi:CIC family chloride channel protein